jgi:Arc/MetJ-type ribon-helix-helix transcriptional regulator
MNIVLTDDLQQLLRSKVENGQFPDEESVIKEALMQFLTGGAPQEHPSTSHTLELDEERLPGPFLEDETVLAPADLPRPGRENARTSLHAARREPDCVPGE